MKHIELNNEIMQKKDGFFNLEKDKEAIKEYMKSEINKKTKIFNSVKERIEWLIENNYYYNVLNDYSIQQIEELHKIADSYNFRFPSYMATTKFYKDYSLKTNDKSQYLENYGQHNVIVSAYLSNKDFDYCKELLRALMEQRYQPSTPTYLNAGRSRRGEMVSCFLLSMDDSLNSINYVLSTCMQLSKIGGGVAVDVSRLRGRGEAIKGVQGAAKGIMPVLKLMEDTFSYADQMG